jgi:HD-GYP domain-containing protein (c-di-GMP phosphodiesterase class II)
MESSNLKNSPLYNSRIIDTYIKLINKKYSYVNIGELLSYAGMKPYEVADQGHWFTQEQIERFYVRLVNITKNEKIAREAGQYAASPDALGVMRQYALGLIGPLHTFELIRQATSNLVKSSIYESRKLSPNKVEIVVTPREEGLEKEFQCENRAGFFEAIVTMFNYKIPNIQHPECMFKGGKVCRYIITWDKTLFAILKKIRNVVTLLVVMLNLALIIGKQWTLLMSSLPVSLLIACLLATVAEKSEKRELKTSLDNTKESIDKLLEQININYNNALMTNEIGQALSTYTHTEDILANVIQIMEKRLDYDRGLILLADHEKTKLELHAGYGYSDDQRGYFSKVSFHLDRPESKGIFIYSFREQRPFLINDLNDIQETLSPRSLTFAKKLGTQSFICCPIICEDKSIGILAVDNMKSKRPLVQSDMSLLMGIASVIGISIRNAELIKARVRQFNSVLHVLAASIDARDSLTAGHSEKVTEYSLGICGELGLPGDYLEMIRVAALLHDYGKIGVPDAILKKEGKLTAEEYEIVKTHSDRSREILAQINFEGIYCEVPEIAGAHHEKVDGSGYPKGLHGKDIPLGAKIIAVADYFEAITAKRHYRDPMPVDEAFMLLREESGKHFESRLVEALINYYSKTYLDASIESGKPDGNGDRRKKPRVPCRTSVFLRADGRTTAAASEDISMSGIYVASDNEVREGAPLELTITLPGNSSSIIEAKGRVVWLNGGREPKKPEFPIGFGVELLEFREATGKVFGAFLSRYKPVNCPAGNN